MIDGCVLQLILRAVAFSQSIEDIRRGTSISVVRITTWQPGGPNPQTITTRDRGTTTTTKRRTTLEYWQQQGRAVLTFEQLAS